jgi:predicted metalloendopeptidase
MSPALVNAAYEPSQNSITIPAAILQGVFFNASRPKYLNYGAIGHVIGHEISHGFDDQGAQYDSEGNLHNWWGEEAKKTFEEKAECFVNQYGSIKVPEVDMNLNGKNTLGENIADNGGLHQSLSAYRSLVDLEGKLPDLDYTTDQLYFVSNANLWCGLIRNEELRNRILTDPHSPAKYRVNVPISNNERFAEVFQCEKGTPMSPENRCELW